MIQGSCFYPITFLCLVAHNGGKPNQKSYFVQHQFHKIYLQVTVERISFENLIEITTEKGFHPFIKRKNIVPK